MGFLAKTKLPEKVLPVEIWQAQSWPQLQPVAGLLQNFAAKINKRFSPNSLREKYPKCVYWQWPFSLPDRVGRNFCLWKPTSIWDTTLETQLGNSKHRLLELSHSFLFSSSSFPSENHYTEHIVFSTLVQRYIKWKACSSVFEEGRESQYVPIILFIELYCKYFSKHWKGSHYHYP